MMDPFPLPSFPPLARALQRWRSADEAFLAARVRLDDAASGVEARSRAERGRAMSQELEARWAVHRISEIELLIPHPLRSMLVAEGVWSAREALDRLVAVDFAARALALGALVPVLSGADLERALQMASRPGWGDDDRWERDEELIQALTARAAALEEGHGGASDIGVPRLEPAEAAPPAREGQSGTSDIGAPPLEPAEAPPTGEGHGGASDIGAPRSEPARREGDGTLAAILQACRVTGEEEWLAPSFAAAIEYVVSDLHPEHAAELARDRDHPLFVDLRSALLARDHDLWSKPWFSSVFDPEERRAHLRRVLERHESATGSRSDRFEGLLDVAERLHGAKRAEVLGWAIAVRKAGARFELTADLARVAALAEGPQRSEPARTTSQAANEITPEAALSPQIEQTLETLLAEDARDDDALCVMAEHLPARLLERIWAARATAPAYRHALALFERRFCELMLAGSDHHGHVLHFVQTLGDDDALLAHARMLAGPDAEESPAS